LKPDYRALSILMESLNQSPKLLRLAWACIAVAGTFAVSALITALRWW